MKPFEEFIEENKVKKGTKNPAEALSLKNQALSRISDVISLPLNEKTASFRFEDAYESIREMIQAFMAKQGYKPYSHEAVIAFASKEKLLSEYEVHNFDRLRKIRNKINYQGKKVFIDEAKQTIEFANNLLKKLSEKFQGST